MKRSINKELLKRWFIENRKEGETREDAIRSISREIGIGKSTFEKVLYVQKYNTSLSTKLLLAQYTGLDFEKLFPTIEQDDEVKAA